MKRLDLGSYREIEGLEPVGSGGEHFRYRGVIDVYSYYFADRGISRISILPGRDSDSPRIRQALKNSEACSRISAGCGSASGFGLLREGLEELRCEYTLLKTLSLDKAQASKTY